MKIGTRVLDLWLENWMIFDKVMWVYNLKITKKTLKTQPLVSFQV